MFSKTINVCLILLTLFVSVSSAEDLNYKPDEVIVRFKPKATDQRRTTDERNQILSSFNAGTVKNL